VSSSIRDPHSRSFLAGGRGNRAKHDGTTVQSGCRSESGYRAPVWCAAVAFLVAERNGALAAAVGHQRTLGIPDGQAQRVCADLQQLMCPER
jgi:hypothetical protein